MILNSLKFAAMTFAVRMTAFAAQSHTLRMTSLEPASPNIL